MLITLAPSPPATAECAPSPAWQRFPDLSKDPMRTLQTPLFLLSFLVPAVAFAQDAPAEDPLATEPAPAEAPAAEPAPAPAPATASASASASLTPAPTGAPQGAPPMMAGPPPTEPSTSSAPRSRGGGPESGKWNFGFAGYFRAPMRIGFGQSGGPQFVDPVTNPDGLVPAYGQTDQNGDGVVDPGVVALTDAAGNPLYHPKQLTIHQPVIPDDQYASYQFTGHNKKEWAEMFFSVGNGTVSGNLAVQAFRFTDAAWQDTTAQFGIGQGWVEVNHDLGFENLKFNAKVGSHWNRYGMAGVYDSGEFDTYIVARTHVIGGTARADVDLGAASVGFEGGVGVNDANPDMNNRSRFTTLAHGHGFLELPSIKMGLHILHAWSGAEVVPNYPARLPSYETEEYNYNSNAAGGTDPGGFVGGPLGIRGAWGPEYPNGSQTIAGIDFKFDLGLFGYFFAGYSHMFLSNALTVGDAIESVHSLGAGEYNIGAVDNYLESPYCPAYGLSRTAPNRSCSNGTGTVGSVMVQYELGLANFGIMPGNQDLKFALYGMLNYVTVDSWEDQWLQGVLDDAAFVNPTLTLNDLKQSGTIKTKFGIDAEYFLTDWFAIAARADHVRPHSKVAGQTFSVLSPRITFKTAAVTHEEISLSCSHYFYESRTCQTTDPTNGQVVVASPAADPFPMAGSPVEGLYEQTNPNTGLPLRVSCVQPAPSGSYPYGFGSHTTNQTAGNRGATTLVPDENVVKLEASIWW